MLLCCEVSHKVLRTDTVYDQIQDIARRDGTNYRRSCEKALLGTICMTKYNNRTYKIDDINWDMTPASKFTWKERDVTYARYYEEKYNKKLKDMKQPLMTCLPSIHKFCTVV